ncbi:metaxin-1 homolog [Stomoxys calcitrans]|uniref:Metaxin n=1 Tax=Stomoxys calcitrans TaxID=35570 RepID=A0A1I8PDB0_STOCA|nr:metaxin-1 homolog [Stomoxys calcitrans]
MKLGAVLYVYKGEFGLPSIDFECCRVLCLIKFTRCPVEIETNSNPLRSGAGKLPYLQIGDEKFVGYRQIKKLLDREGYPIDHELRLKDRHLSECFANWVFTNLHVYYHYYLYGEPNNFDVTRALYAKRTPFPFNFYYPSTYQKDAHDIISVMGGFDLDDKLEHHNVDYITNNAKKCINVLSKRLGRNMWFFGDHYSEFDAIVFSYLSILFKINLPTNPIQNHIKGCPNLVNFINRISRDIFKREAFNSINTSKDNASPNDPMLTATERKFLESEKKTKILAGIGAVLAMGTFAALKIFYKKFSSSNDYYDGPIQYDDDDIDEEDMD